MNIQTLHGQRLFNLVNQVHKQFIPGQIVEGNILKLFPNNQAQIRFSNSQILLAQLEASLNIGERYHFQVQTNDQVLHLKVIGEQLSQQPKQNAESLLRHFGFKVSKPHIQFVQSLIDEKIPFNKQQLQQSLQLLNQTDHKPTAMQAIKQMMTLQLPMNETTFQALYQKDRHQLTTLMREVAQLIRQEPNPSPAQQQVQQVLSRMLDVPMNQATQVSEHQPSRQQLPLMESIRAVQQLISQQADPEYIKAEIERLVIPRLSSEQQPIFRQLLQVSTLNLNELNTVLESLKQDVQPAQTQMTNMNPIVRAMPLMLVKDQFMTLLHDYMQFIGTSDEHTLSEGRQPTLSLKAFLLQAIEQESSTVFKQQAQTLIHMLNGVQLQSMHESQFFLQASLQIPSEKFSLNEDIFIDFESKKTPDGKIDPDHARVLFYLNLGNIKETVIDMQVQRRHVSLTLYNDRQDLHQLVTVLQPLLNNRLESLNYHLTSIHVKPLAEQQPVQQQSRSHAIQSYEGIDFRV